MRVNVWLRVSECVSVRVGGWLGEWMGVPFSGGGGRVFRGACARRAPNPSQVGDGGEGGDGRLGEDGGAVGPVVRELRPRFRQLRLQRPPAP